MLRLRTLSVAAVALLAGTAASQTYQMAGFTYQSDTSATSRGALSGLAGSILARIDRDDYRDWGVSVDKPGKHDIRGIVLIVQDQDLATNESFTVEGYGENPTVANTPDPADKFLSGAPLPMPPGTGPGAFLVTVVFSTPALADGGEDTFLGIGVPANTVWPGDGLSVHMWFGAVTSGFSTYDVPGPGMPPFPRDTYGHNLPANATLAPVQFMVDPLLDETSGVATAVTNQTTFPQSGSAPGTASFFSGLHPDAANPPKNAGRVDDPGFRVHDADLAGDQVLFFLGTDFAPSIYIGQNNQGTVCVDVTAMWFVGMATGSNPGTPPDFGGEASITIPLGAAAVPIRSAIRGISLVWWALGVDQGGVLRGSSCAKQRF